MSQTLSQDLRSRVIGAVDGGMSRSAAARRFGVGISTAIRWVREWRITGSRAARPKGGDLRSHRVEAFRELLLSTVEARKDITLVELAAMLERDHGAVFAPSTIWRFLDRHGMTFKKTAHASEQERPDVAKRRSAWFDAQPDLDPERLVFIDETGASTKMARLRGRALRGQRCRAPVPHGHWLTTTFTGALRLSGLTAPMLLDGPMNRDAFEAYVEQVLVPTLVAGDVVILDNLPAHKSVSARTRSRQREQRSAFFPRIRPISTRSSTPSPSSRPSSARPLHARSTDSGMLFATRCQASRQTNAQTTSPQRGYEPE